MSSPKPDYDTPPAAPYTTPPALIAFTLTVLVLCFVGFSIVFLCRYCFMSVLHTWAFQRTASGALVRLSPNTSPQRGLDPSLLQIFPTFLYSSVKDLRKEKYSLECAICLLEFEDDSMLRLLTVCCHVFHQECIDLWLCSHKTCPVCRTDLDSPTKDIRKSQELGVDNHHAEESMESLTEDEIRIDVNDGEGDDGVGERAGDQRHEHEHDHDYPVSMSMSMQQQEEQRFARSHSTGHSIVLIREGDEENDDDKYTLRLPVHVIRGGHNSTRSCASYKEMITRPAAPCSNCGFVQTVSGCSSLCHTEKT